MEDEEGYGALSSEMDGFSINWMTLRDGENVSRVFWKADNWDMNLKEKDEVLNAEILGC